MGVDFTQKEKDHYDKSSLSQKNEDPVRVYQNTQNKITSDFNRLAYYGWLKAAEKLPQKSDLKILDYGTGKGHHAITLQQRLPMAEIIGIDISGSSIELGKRMAIALFKDKKPQFIEMDAHHLTFEDETFDCVCDFGTLSSLEFNKAISEIHRVLKPGGTFLALETFGHNPITNLKRKINVLRGSRTHWASTHIVTNTKLRVIEKTFSSSTFQFFSLATLFYGISPFKSASFLQGMEQIDGKILKWNFLKKYAFKVLCEATK